MDESFTSSRGEYNMIRNQLEQEKFPGKKPNESYVSFLDLPKADQNIILKKRVSEYSRKIYGKAHETNVVQKTSIVCQRENPFYIDTVRNFRDRRYEYKAELKKWKGNLERAHLEEDAPALDEAQKMVVIYDSLQIAHKCILNSFYGYVMRKGFLR
jgi:DNA polymerase epsilon subunit 1